MSNNVHPIPTSKVQFDATSNSEVAAAIADMVAFREGRGWGAAHTMENLAKSLSIEASEVLEIFQWNDGQTPLSADESDHLNEELADVLIYAFYLCQRNGVDPLKVIQAKMAINQHREW